MGFAGPSACSDTTQNSRHTAGVLVNPIVVSAKRSSILKHCSTKGAKIEELHQKAGPFCQVSCTSCLAAAVELWNLEQLATRRSCWIPFYSGASNTVPPIINLVIAEVWDLRMRVAGWRCMVILLPPHMKDKVHRSGPAEATGPHVQSIKIIQRVSGSHCISQQSSDWLLPRSSTVMMPNKSRN